MELNLFPLNVNPMAFNLFGIQLSLSGQRTNTPSRIQDLEDTIRDTQFHHKLYDLDVDNLGDVTLWATQKLGDREVEHLTRTISNQKRYFWNWHLGGLWNAKRFLQKGSKVCYCDPFTPQPKVYSGHLTFYPNSRANEEMLEVRDRRRAENPDIELPPIGIYTRLMEGSEREHRFYIGDLKFKIDERRSKLLVRMKRKLWKDCVLEFKIENGKIQKFKDVLGAVSRHRLIPVDTSVDPIGRVWHAYGLRDFIAKVNSNDCVFYQMNTEGVMVAGIYERQDWFRIWCVNNPLIAPFICEILKEVPEKYQMDCLSEFWSKNLCKSLGSRVYKRIRVDLSFVLLHFGYKPMKGIDRGIPPKRKVLEMMENIPCLNSGVLRRVDKNLLEKDINSYFELKEKGETDGKDDKEFQVMRDVITNMKNILEPEGGKDTEKKKKKKEGRNPRANLKGKIAVRNYDLYLTTKLNEKYIKKISYEENYPALTRYKKVISATDENVTKEFSGKTIQSVLSEGENLIHKNKRCSYLESLSSSQKDNIYKEMKTISNGISKRGQLNEIAKIKSHFLREKGEISMKLNGKKENIESESTRLSGEKGKMEFFLKKALKLESKKTPEWGKKKNSQLEELKNKSEEMGLVVEGINKGIEMMKSEEISLRNRYEVLMEISDELERVETENFIKPVSNSMKFLDFVGAFKKEKHAENLIKQDGRKPPGDREMERNIQPNVLGRANNKSGRKRKFIKVEKSLLSITYVEKTPPRGNGKKGLEMGIESKKPKKYEKERDRRNKKREPSKGKKRNETVLLKNDFFSLFEKGITKNEKGESFVLYDKISGGKSFKPNIKRYLNETENMFVIWNEFSKGELISSQNLNGMLKRIKPGDNEGEETSTLKYYIGEFERRLSRREIEIKEI